jgi:hypothetical protein
MKSHLFAARIVFFGGLFLSDSALAGHLLERAPDKTAIIEPAEDKLPDGNFTLGAKFSAGVSEAYLDSVTPFWGPGDFTFALNTRTRLQDDSQYISSYGLGVRYLVPGRDIIIGGNAFYDAIDSRYGNQFDQLGLGVELLTRWFDARANWYLPDDSTYEIDSFHSSDTQESTGSTFVENSQIKRRTTRTIQRQTFKRYESAREGFYVEGGFLVPGLDEYLELRLLAGYYRYTSAFGQRSEGFKARAEARLLPGLIADLEYWDDIELNDGHWVAGIRVTLPFSIGNLLTGKNPFEGTREMFTPRKREFRERLSEMVIRTPLVSTDASGKQLTHSITDQQNSDHVLSNVPAPSGGGKGKDER